MKFTSLLISFLLSHFLAIGSEVKFQPVQPFENDSITAIMISRNFPWMTNEGKLICYDPESAFIFFKNDWVLYKIPYDFSIHKLSDSGIYEVDKIEKRTRYLIRENNDSIGYFTDSSLNTYFLKCSLDSVFMQFWPLHPFMDSSWDKNNIGSIDSLAYRIGKTHYSAYTFQNKTDSSQQGTITLEFTDSFPAVNYSISSKLDTVKGIKLTNIEVFNQARYFREYNITIDAVKQFRKIELFKYFDKLAIAPFFEFMQRRKIEE